MNTPPQTHQVPQTRQAQMRAYRLGALMRLALCLVIATSLILLVAKDLVDHRQLTRGIESGLMAGPIQRDNRFAVNTALDQCDDLGQLIHELETVNAMGVGAIRQRFSWAEIEPYPGSYDWSFCDTIIPFANNLGLDVIAVLDQAPAWARAEWEQDNPWAPPSDLSTYTQFTIIFAQRYGQQIDAYQIWDSPNIAPHWGSGPIDPAAYVDMLAASSAAIRQADPDAIIVTGALVPNTEPGGRNMSDVQFLRECYRRDASHHFDIVGYKALGFWSGPQDRRVDDQILNLSRVILLREEMRRRGDATKPIWAMDSGWCALPENWQGRPNPAGSDSHIVQTERTLGAYNRIQQEWPWMTLVCTPMLQPHASVDDPAWGYALLDASGEPTHLGKQLTQQLLMDDIVYPGHYENPKSQWDAHPHEWRVDLRIWGTKLKIEIHQNSAPGELGIAIAGRPNLDVSLPPKGIWSRAVTVARYMAPQTHQVAFHGQEAEIGSIQSLSVGHEVNRLDPIMTVLTAFLALMLVAEEAFKACQILPWADTWYKVRVYYYKRLPTTLQTLGVIVGGSLALWAPWLPVRLIGLLFIATASATHPRLILLWTVAIIPFAPLHVHLGGLSLSLLEITTWFAIAGQMLNIVLSHDPIRRLAALWRDVCWLDWAVLGLVALGLVSSAISEYPHVALREWRTVILGASAAYALVRVYGPNRETLLSMMDAMVIGATLVALYAIVVYTLPVGVIEAEGVRRARAFFGSPNNLALCLERYLPLAFAVVLAGSHGIRRWRYGISAGILAIALALSFSRAALLIALPVGTLVVLLGLMPRRRWLLIAVLLVMAALVVPMAGTERFASLWDTSQGTTALRINLWRSSWRMAVDHPLLGVGPDNFLYYYGDYILPAALDEPNLSHPHNVLLDFWLRLGLGGVAVLAMILIGYRQAWQSARSNFHNDAHSAVLVGILGGLVASLAHGLVDAWFFVPELACYFMASLAWVVAASRDARDDVDETPTQA